MLASIFAKNKFVFILYLTLTRQFIGRILYMYKRLIVSSLFLLFSGITYAQPSLNFASGLGLNKVPLASGGQNIVLNGSFENGLPTTTDLHYWGPNTTAYTPVASVFQWNTAGGGTLTDAAWFDDSAFAGTSYTLSPSPDGNASIYLGTGITSASQMPTHFANGLVTWASTPVFGAGPYYNTATAAQYGWSTGLTLSQTLTGLTVGETYGLSFKAGGEVSGEGAQYGIKDGVFRLDLSGSTGGTTQTWLTAPSGASNSLLQSGGVAEDWHLYEFTFIATDPSMTLGYTNFGRLDLFGQPGFTPSSATTELVLDDVRVNSMISGAGVSAPEPATLALLALGGLFMRKRRK
jgi:PEP-CTERM motif